MCTLAFRLVFVGLCLQVSTCYPSCTLYWLLANCAGQQHRWVPALPSNITILYLERNNIGEISRTSLIAYNQLHELDLGMQSVPLIIRNNAFLRQRKLTRLVLGNNIGLTLEPRAFAGLYNLQHLFLDHCSFTDSILSENYLQPLTSLEKLNLFGNQIVRLRPGQFFSKLTKFTELDLKLNQIERLCEEDLVGFRGKSFTLLNLQSNHLFKMYTGDFNWTGCGNAFTGMSFNTLDLSTTGLSLSQQMKFFTAIQGTPIAHLILQGYIGADFSHKNFEDPNSSTYEALANSTVNIFDLSGNRIYALQKAVFSPLRDAIIIDVSRNKINQIKTGAFIGLQGHLRMLNLSSNLLGDVRSETFANLTDLRVLDLSHNHIGVLGYKAFSGLPRLRALYLTGNSLRNLGFSVSLPNLDWLLLGDNKLETLSGIINLGNNSLIVDISYNRLTNFRDLFVIASHFDRLQHFFMAGNFIKWCTPTADMPHNSSLLTLDLHDSSLQIVWLQGFCFNLFNHFENLKGLNLSFNSLTALPQGVFSGLSAIIEIDLSYNTLTFLMSNTFPVSLRTLNLSNNFLATPDPSTFQSVILLNLEANRFLCDCNLESFLTWLNTTDVIPPSQKQHYRCELPAARRNLTLNYSMITEPCEEDHEKDVQALQFALFISTALLTLTAILSGICYARLRRHIFIFYKKIVGRVVEGPKPTPPVDDVQYDAFFCFSNRDYEWVEAALLKKLDIQFTEGNLLRCCFEARDFLPGEDHLSNIRDAIWGSRKTVCIVSKEFLKDGWCLEAFGLAQGRMLEELTNILIMLVVGKVAHYQLMKYNAVRAFVQQREYLIWPEDPQDLEWFYEHLVSQILKNTKLKKVAKDEPEPAQPDVQPQDEDGIELENIQAVPM